MPTRPWADWYDNRRWRRRRRLQLIKNPWCEICLKQGTLGILATVVDHVEPHKGDITKFWLGKLQSLCAHHHNSYKKQDEMLGYAKDIGADGWPIDERHPVYTGKVTGGHRGCQGES